MLGLGGCFFQLLYVGVKDIKTKKGKLEMWAEGWYNG